MKQFSMIISIIALIAFVVLFAINTAKNVSANKKAKVLKVDYKEEYKRSLIYSAIIGGTFAIAMTTMLGWAVTGPTAIEVVCAIIGGFFTGGLMSVVLSSFILHYYGKDVEQTIDKWMFRILAITFPLMFVFIFILSDAFANHLIYPLVNGISFGDDGIKFVTPKDGKASIAWYALCILSGAIYVYLLCDHKYYMNYKKHGILESTFLVAFPAGIIGARIFYVIGQWDAEFKGQEWWKPFAMWEGGLTILGGALMGIVVGVAWYMWRNRKYNIWVGIDIIVPTILIAQAVGRWGNFFNTEVHGIEMSVEYWKWLPTVIWKNAQYGLSNGIKATEGNLFVPLFLIEGMTNFLGYFVIAHLFGNKFRKYTEFGDLGFAYFIWYGLTRAILEPMRHEDFIMTDSWSWIWGLSFILGGVLLIIGNHVVRHILAVKNNKYIVRENAVKKSIIGMSVVGLISVVGLVVGFVLIANSDMKLIVEWNVFKGGILAVVVSICILLFISIPAIHLVEAIKDQKKEKVING